MSVGQGGGRRRELGWESAMSNIRRTVLQNGRAISAGSPWGRLRAEWQHRSRRLAVSRILRVLVCPVRVPGRVPRYVAGTKPQVSIYYLIEFSV